jgi:ABC-type lipoprotein export system ATPase subunit
MIAVSNLSFAYNGAQALTFPDFVLRPGEHGLLLGQSGSGKTTLLHLLGGLLRGYSGSIVVDGTELASLSETALDRFRGQHMGFVFQKSHLITALTVEKNLMLAPYLSGAALESGRIADVLGGLGLAEKRGSKVTALSHGQAQRVAIARAILNKPSILFADEPTSALDDTNCGRVIRLLLDVATRNGSTLLVATHDQRVKDQIQKQIILPS